MPVFTLPYADSTSVRAKALVFEDPQSRALLARLTQVAPSEATVLICGETGTGKEIVARHVHELSARRRKPFVGVNCGALPESLVESELFGHERGAFTGALQTKVGWFEAAHGGTLFLDEIGDLPLQTQVKLLRVLQEGEVVRLGSRTPQRIDVRLIAATNVRLEDAVRAGRFREDLYYRLNVAPLTLLPLRERPLDILPIAEHFLVRYAERLGLECVPQLGPDASHALLNHTWPGNIRELENAVHHALLVGSGDAVRPEDLRLSMHLGGLAPAHKPALPLTAAETSTVRASPMAHVGPAHADDGSPDAFLERGFTALFEQAGPQLFDRVIEQLVLSAYRYCERNQVHTARLLGISRNVLRARLQQAGELSAGTRGKSSRDLVPRSGLTQSRVRIGFQRYGLLPLVKASRALERAFAAQSIEVEWHEFATGPQLVDAFAASGLSIGLVGEVPPIFAQAAEVPMVYLAAEAPAPDHEAILVPEHSDVRSVEELRGKTVLVSRGSNVQYFLVLALEAARLSYADVRVVYASPAHARSIFASGQVDAWVTWEPFLGIGQRELGARVLRSAHGLTSNTSYYIGARDFVAGQPELVALFLEQLREVARWMERDQHAAANMLATSLDLPLTAAVPGLLSRGEPEPFDVSHLVAQQTIADKFRRLGLIDTSVDISRAWTPSETSKQAWTARSIA